LKKFRQLVIGISIAVLAVYFTLRNVSMKDLMESFKTIHYFYLVPATLLIIGTYVVRAYRWQILLSPIKQVSLKSMFPPLMIGFMGNILPARAGEVLRAYLLSKQQNVTFTGAVATIVVERLFDLIMLLLLFVWVLVFHADVFSDKISWGGITIHSMANKFGMLGGVFILVLVAFIYMLAFHKDRLMPLLKWCMKPVPHKWHEKIEELIGTFSEGLMVAKDNSALVKITISTIALWALIVLTYYPFYWAFDIQNKSIESLLIVTVMVCILITILPTPGFLGSFQAGILIGLHEIMHEAEIASVSFGWVCWALNFLLIVVLGVYFILHDHLSMHQLVDLEKEGEEILDHKR
jgi:uncharacterized protein (TIRG00374 family)